MPTVVKVATPQLRMSPLPHQERVSDRLEEEHGLLAYHQTGSGKTMTAVNAAHEHNLPLLAVVPAALRNNMRKGIQDAGFKGPHTVVSYEEASKRMNDPAFREQAANSLVAFDEAARMGQADSARSNLAHGLPAKKKLFLTGTPIRNDPSEIAPLINGIAPGSLPADPKNFKAKYVETREVPVGFVGRVLGLKPGKEYHPKNLHEFEKAVRGKVDFYKAVDRQNFPSYHESIIETPMSDKQDAAYKFVMGRYPAIAYKIRHGLPPNRSEEANFRAFFSGPRQVSNHPAPFHAKAGDQDAAKIQRAADEIEKRHKSDPNFRGVAYSAFLDTGVAPLSRELHRRGIPHSTFTGELDDVERKQVVDHYNRGKVPVMLISGAGAEGLDLKGTKLLQILEPHWNEEQIHQVKSRGVRYKSHAHLPEDERHVEIQRFHSVPQAGWFDRLLGRTRAGEKSVDEYLYDRANEKKVLNDSFLQILQGRSAAQVERGLQAKQSNLLEENIHDGECLEINPTHERRQAILFDLDGTLVHVSNWADPMTQTVLPGRAEFLARLRDKGYCLAAVTNRAVYGPDQSPATVHAQCERTDELLPGLLEDIYYIPDGPHPAHKPAPDMLVLAIHRLGLDPDNTVFVGDSEDDRGAAEAAGIPWYHPDQFFALVADDFPKVAMPIQQSDTNPTDLLRAERALPGQAPPAPKPIRNILELGAARAAEHRYQTGAEGARSFGPFAPPPAGYHTVSQKDLPKLQPPKVLPR